MSRSAEHLEKGQLIALIALRWLIGWHLLYEGIAKITNPYWSAAGFLSAAHGPLAGLYVWLASDGARLAAVDWLNQWGLTLLGLALLLGVFGRASTICAIVLLALYYLGDPPLPGLESVVPAEGSYLLVNKTLIEIAALFVLLKFPTTRQVGLDVWLVRTGEAR